MMQMKLVFCYIVFAFVYVWYYCKPKKTLLAYNYTVSKAIHLVSYICS